MSTFAKGTYDAAKYLALRPTYPRAFFDFLKGYAQRGGAGAGDIGVAVDVGSGPGEAARQVATIAAQVTALEPSAVMVAEGRRSGPPENVRFVEGPDTALVKHFRPGTVDLVTAAQAAHWFTYPDFFEQVATVLRPGGTLAIWGYADFAIAGAAPGVLDIVKKYNYDPQFLGSFWPRGREILGNNYRDLLPLPAAFGDVEHHTLAATADPKPGSEPLDITQTALLREIGNYMRTASSYHSWREAHPDTPPEADPVALCLGEISELTGLGLDDEVTVRWNSVYLLAKKL